MAKQELRVTLKSFGRLLQAFQKRRGANVEDVREIAAGVEEAIQEGTWNPVPFLGNQNPSLNDINAFLISIQNGVDTTVEVGQLYGLADACKIPALMLDPYVAQEVDDRLKLVADDFVEAPSHGNHHGAHCTYRVPLKRLRGSETAFVSLTLERGGTSDTHDHPGDELMLALDGSVDAYLDSNGTQNRLNEGDFIHFNAEHQHSAHAVEGQEKDSEVFIIRFYQLQYGGTRQRIVDCLNQAYDELMDSQRRLSEKSVAEIRGFAGDWLRQVIAAPVPVHGQPSAIQHPVSLGRFLNQIRSDQGLTDDDLRERLDRFNVALEFGTLQRIMKGRGVDRKRGRDLLDQLAIVFKLPKILLYGFLFPTVADVVVVRNERDLSNPKSRFHLFPVDYPAPNGSVAKYYVPRRSLAGSDISVVHLLLPPGAESPPNTHPGSELVLPRSGTAEIRFFDDNLEERPDHRLIVNPNELAHYRSGVYHQVRNPGDVEADLFLVRFHEFE